MSRPNLLARLTRTSFIMLVLVFACCLLNPALADQKTNPEPVRTSLPAGESTHASKVMMAPIMSQDERNAVYLQWGLVMAGGLVAITGLVVWVFLNTRKESDENDEHEDENAYTVGTLTPSPAPVDESKPAVSSSPSPTSSTSSTGAASSESQSSKSTGLESDAASTVNKTDS